MVKKTVLFIILLSAVAGFFLFADEGGFSLNVQTGAEKMFGFTNYAIGWNAYDLAGYSSPIGFKLSELVFPLDCYFVKGTIDLRFLKKLAAGLVFAKSVYSPSGIMEDSDWGVWYLDDNSWASPETLDVFSASESNLRNAYTIDTDVRYILSITPGLGVSFGLGFIFQYYYFELSDLDQWYPSYETYSAYLDPSYSEHVTVSGLVGTYEVMYIIPLVKAVIHMDITKKFAVNFIAGYSPFTRIFDADDHILRSKLSHGDCTGMTLKGSFDGQYDLTRLFSIGWNAEIMAVSAKGKQDQILYNDTPEGSAGPVGSIDMKITGLQFSAGIYLGIKI